MFLVDEFRHMQIRQKATVAGLALVSAAAWGVTGYNLLDLRSLARISWPHATEAGDSYHAVQRTIKAPEDSARFMKALMEKSREGLVVVMVGRQGCAECPGMDLSLAEARYQLRGLPFSAFIIDPETNPGIAEQIGHQPGDSPRFYTYHRGEKIHVSHGISERVSDLTAYLDGLYNLAMGKTSHLDRYQP